MSITHNKLPCSSFSDETLSNLDYTTLEDDNKSDTSSSTSFSARYIDSRYVWIKFLISLLTPWKVFKANLDKCLIAFCIFYFTWLTLVSPVFPVSTIGWVLRSSVEKLGWFGKLGSLETSLISKFFVFQTILIFPYCSIGIPTYE